MSRLVEHACFWSYPSTLYTRGQCLLTGASAFYALIGVAFLCRLIWTIRKRCRHNGSMQLCSVELWQCLQWSIVLKSILACINTVLQLNLIFWTCFAPIGSVSFSSCMPVSNHLVSQASGSAPGTWQPIPFFHSRWIRPRGLELGWSQLAEPCHGSHMSRITCLTPFVERSRKTRSCKACTQLQCQEITTSLRSALVA
eukprot:6485466-Amphidinium_carterae.1